MEGVIVDAWYRAPFALWRQAGVPLRDARRGWVGPRWLLPGGLPEDLLAPDRDPVRELTARRAQELAEEHAANPNPFLALSTADHPLLDRAMAHAAALDRAIRDALYGNAFLLPALAFSAEEGPMALERWAASTRAVMGPGPMCPRCGAFPAYRPPRTPGDFHVRRGYAIDVLTLEAWLGLCEGCFFRRNGRPKMAWERPVRPP